MIFAGAFGRAGSRVDDVTQFATQLLNGLQLGVALFLMSAGLTLVLGIMNFVNLAHGSFFMIAAYVAATTYKYTQSFILSGVAAVASAFAVGIAVETICLRKLYDRDHLAQVLATFGLTLFFNEAVRIIWGPAGIFAAVPPFLSGHLEIVPGLRLPNLSPGRAGRGGCHRHRALRRDRENPGRHDRTCRRQRPHDDRGDGH